MSDASMSANGDPASLAAQIAIGVLSNLIFSGMSSVGSRIQIGLAPGRRDRARQKDLLLGALRGEALPEPTLVQLLKLAESDASAMEISTALGSRSAQAATQQIICASLLGSSTTLQARIETTFEHALLCELPSELTPESARRIARGALTVVKAAVDDTLRPAWDNEKREVSADVLASLTLIHASIDSIEGTLAALAQRDSSPSDALADSAWISSYLKLCSRQHGFITPPDFRERNAVPIDDIYVAGRTIVAEPKGAHSDHRSVLELGTTIDRDVLLGDPGGGKSTAISAIAHQLSNQTGALIPFVVVLREFAPRSEQISIVEFIEAQLKTKYQAPEAPAGLVDALLHTGRCAVLFDGLDELLEPSRRVEMAKRVEQFSTRYPASRILVTSRKVGYKEAQLDPAVFKVNVLDGYSEPDVAEYVGKWFALQTFAAPVSVEEVTDAFLRESAAILDLRNNPLLLALLCIIYRGQGYLPKNRIGIYEECAKLLFETWDKSRNLSFDFSFESYIVDALKHLALWMFTSSDASADGVTEDRLVDELSSFFVIAYDSPQQALKAAQEFIEFCRGRAWVLSEAGTTPEGVALFKFTHRTFMEYFAAYQLTRLYPTPIALARHLIPRISKNEWDTVGQLAIHLINRSVVQGAEKALNQMLTSSANRSVRYRENTVGFIARCLDYLAVSPALVKASFRRSTDVILQAKLSGSNSSFYELSSWKLLCYLEERHDAGVEYEARATLNEWLTSNNAQELEAAAFVVCDIAWRPRDGSTRPRARSREERWLKFALSIAEEHIEALMSDSEWKFITAVNLLAYRYFTFEEFVGNVVAPGELPLDFIYRRNERGFNREPASSFAQNLIGSVPTWLDDPPRTEDVERGFVGWREISGMIWDGILSKSNPPWVSSANADVLGHWPAFHQSTSEEAVLQELPPELVSTYVLLCCCFAEISADKRWSSRPMAERYSARLIYELAELRNRGIADPGQPDFLSEAKIALQVMPQRAVELFTAWLAGAVSFTDLAPNGQPRLDFIQSD